MSTPNYEDPRAAGNAFSIGQQELLRLKKRVNFIEEAFDKLDDDPTDSIPTKLSELQNDVGFITEDDIPAGSGGTGSATSLQTWKGDGSATYGEEYILKAVWNGDVLKLACCDNETCYLVQCDKVPWSGVTGAPEFLTESQVRAIVSEMIG